jgi:hypothetical protein
MTETEIVNIEAIEQFLDEYPDTSGCVYCIHCFPNEEYPPGSIVTSLCGKQGPKLLDTVDQMHVECHDCAEIDKCPTCGMYIWFPWW